MSTFAEIRAQVLELLQQEGRVAYRVLKRQFALDDDYIEDLKADLIDAKRLAECSPLSVGESYTRPCKRRSGIPQ